MSMTDGEHIYISTELVGDGDITLIVQTGSTYHESYHILFTDFSQLLNTLPDDATMEQYVGDQMVHMFGNLLEDVRIESAAHQLYKGATMYLQMKNFALLDFMLIPTLEKKITEADYLDMNKKEDRAKMIDIEAEHSVHSLTSLTKFGHNPAKYVNPKRQLRFIRRVAPVIESGVTAKNTGEQLVWAEFLAYEFMKWYPKIVEDNVDKMKEEMEGVVLMIVGNGPPGAKPVDVDIDKPLNVILIILEDPKSQSGSSPDGPPINIVEILDLRDKKEDKDGEDGDDSSGKSDGGEGEDEDGESEDGSPGEEAQGEDESSPSNKGEDFPGESERKTPGEKMIDSHSELAPDTKQQMKKMMKKAKEGVDKDLRVQEKIEEHLSKDDERYIEVGNVKRVGDGHEVKYIRQNLERDYDEYLRLKQELSRSTGTIANKIHNLLLDAKAARHVRNLPSGDLDRRSLYRVDTSTSLFKRTVIPKVKDTIFTILVDGSGSMSYRSKMDGGRKEVWAMKSCIYVSEILSKVEDVDFEIIVYNGWNQSQDYYLIKSFGEPYSDRVRAALAVPHSSNGNVDAAAIEVAVARQDAMPQKEKIIINICDGNPTDSPYRNMNGNEALRHVLEKFKKRKIIGIGILGDMSYTPADFYKYYVEVKDIKRLPWELATVIRRILRR